jgi:hypothetical protein
VERFCMGSPSLGDWQMRSMVWALACLVIEGQHKVYPE